MFSCFIALIANGNTSIVGLSPGLWYALTYPYTLGGKWIITSVYTNCPAARLIFMG